MKSLWSGSRSGSRRSERNLKIDPDRSNAEKELAKSKAELTVIKETKMTRELNEILLKFGL